MERKLASIQRVLAIEPIPNADAIELARINGWQCVVKKNEFQVGSLGVFLEIDSVPPDTQTFDFLWQPKPKEGEPLPDKIERPASFRIRTMKLRGMLSQGLLLPLNQFGLNEASEGDDVTETLSVTKYDPPLPFARDELRAMFPGYVPKTDEMRVQSVPQVLDEMRGLPYVMTLKCDGTSSTFCIHPRDWNEFHVCGRNYSLKDGDNFYWNIARQYEIEEILRRAPHLAIQGEICGPGIQRNRLALKALTLFVFNVYDIKTARYLDDAEMRRFCADNNLTPVAIVEQGDSFEYSMDELLARAEGKYDNTSNEREGVVIRPTTERRSEILAGRLSFKTISNRFLLKEGD
ncbi:MAG TPA: RNA ligase (ATP) [Abditibacteriaceae bacterium]|nr:RNA ligase (ATP) [Abditibacteriaceae bacterium]